MCFWKHVYPRVDSWDKDALAADLFWTKILVGEARDKPDPGKRGPGDRCKQQKNTGDDESHGQSHPKSETEGIPVVPQ